MPLVEQDALAALRIADRIYVLEQGHIVREGARRELFEDNASIGDRRWSDLLEFHHKHGTTSARELANGAKVLRTA